MGYMSVALGYTRAVAGCRSVAEYRTLVVVDDGISVVVGYRVVVAGEISVEQCMREEELQQEVQMLEMMTCILAVDLFQVVLQVVATSLSVSGNNSKCKV